MTTHPLKLRRNQSLNRNVLNRGRTGVCPPIPAPVTQTGTAVSNGYALIVKMIERKSKDADSDTITDFGRIRIIGKPYNLKDDDPLRSDKDKPFDENNTEDQRYLDYANCYELAEGKSATTTDPDTNEETTSSNDEKLLKGRQVKIVLGEMIDNPDYQDPPEQGDDERTDIQKIEQFQIYTAVETREIKTVTLDEEVQIDNSDSSNLQVVTLTETDEDDTEYETDVFTQYVPNNMYLYAGSYSVERIGTNPVRLQLVGGDCPQISSSNTTVTS